MRFERWKMALGSCFLATLLAAPMWGADRTTRHNAVPGTLNYVEGEASIGDQSLNSQSVGQAQLQNGDVLQTGNGKAEILLTPGVYLRVGGNSQVKMISNSITNTEVAVSQGEAMAEVDQLYKENNLRISQPGADTRIEKNGLYDFNATDGAVRVFDGKAVVRADDHDVTVKKNHELAFNSEKLKARGFDKNEVTKNDDLYRWSSLRSEYLAEANVNVARTNYVNGWYGPGWWGPGWYWNPLFAGYTFVPGSGFFYNPFGWGFYSPLMVYRAPVVVVGGVHHFNGNRPVAIGRGFHSHAVRSYRSGAVRGPIGLRAGGMRGGAAVRGGVHR